MPNRFYRAVWVSLLSVGMLAVRGFAVSATPPISKDDATLSSDEMELTHNSSTAVFTGHVLLEKTSYKLKADRMVREQNTGVANAEGHIVGTWLNPAGGKLVAQGDHATYDPKTETAELWTRLPKQVAMQWNDAKGSGHFLSDRAFVYTTPKHVRLVDHVTGHIIPAPKP